LSKLNLGDLKYHLKTNFKFLLYAKQCESQIDRYNCFKFCKLVPIFLKLVLVKFQKWQIGS